MKFKKPNFWDYKRPNFISYLLLPLTIPVILNNILINIVKSKGANRDNIKTICLGNIYIGGTGKTPLAIKLSSILKKLNYKTGIIKKFYTDQLDEQKLLNKDDKLYLFKKRKESLNAAIAEKIEVAIFDDGLQDKSVNYDIEFLCFNSEKWIGNGFLIPAGPLREKIDSIVKYDGVFLNGNNEDISNLKNLIKKYNLPTLEKLLY